jgi:FKBP-type peptidyl-prolyl cis-trans isomerase
MHKNLVAVGVVASLALGCSQVGIQDPLSSSEKKESYGLGAMIGQQLGAEVAGLDQAAFLAGMRDALADKTQLTNEEIASLLEARTSREQLAAAKAAQEAAQRNEASGAVFRENFAKQQGVETLASGLQYKILEEGDGAVASESDQVTLHYRASFIDGRELDSTYGGEPVSVAVDRVIPGWSEALQQMPAGSSWQIVVPPELAFGPTGSGDRIEPGTTLVFEIELVAVG